LQNFPNWGNITILGLSFWVTKNTNPSPLRILKLLLFGEINGIGAIRGCGCGVVEDSSQYVAHVVTTVLHTFKTKSTLNLLKASDKPFGPFG
jgi:hypothetical protein